MWCASCQQDVPGVVSRDRQRLCCPRCLEDLPTPASTTLPADPTWDFELPELSHRPLPDFETVANVREAPGWEAWGEVAEDWELDDELQAMEDADHSARDLGVRLRIDGAHRLAGTGAGPVKAPQVSVSLAAPDIVPAPASSRRRPGPSWFAEVAVAVGVGAVAGGIAWQIRAMQLGRHELASWGLAGAVVGLGALLIGLLMLNSHAIQQREQLHREVESLRRDTQLLAAGHQPTTPAFYTHLAGGASPELLLAELRGQVDLLAARLADSSRRVEA